jgi:hypothetical protein
MSSFSEKHEALKHKIHNTRIPLKGRALHIVQVIYVVAPVVLGYGIMQATNWYADRFSKGDIEEKRRRRVGDAFDGSAPIETIATDSTRAAQSVIDLVALHRRQAADGTAASSAPVLDGDGKKVKEPHPWARGGSVWQVPTARLPPKPPAPAASASD